MIHVQPYNDSYAALLLPLASPAGRGRRKTSLSTAQYLKVLGATKARLRDVFLARALSSKARGRAEEPAARAHLSPPWTR